MVFNFFNIIQGNLIQDVLVSFLFGLWDQSTSFPEWHSIRLFWVLHTLWHCYTVFVCHFYLSPSGPLRDSDGTWHFFVNKGGTCLTRTDWGSPGSGASIAVSSSEFGGSSPLWWIITGGADPFFNSTSCSASCKSYKINLSFWILFTKLSEMTLTVYSIIDTLNI